MPDDIQPGHVGWVDLTVDNASEVRDFYLERLRRNEAAVYLPGALVLNRTISLKDSWAAQSTKSG